MESDFLGLHPAIPVDSPGKQTITIEMLP